jgi:dTDP-4-amino-4,6-dideoxygalactose transaminase
MYRIGKEEIDEVKKVIEGKVLFRVNDGNKEVERFEKELARLVGVKYALCVTGGTAALTCALVGMGIGPGDEVIVPAYTFMATALAVAAVGAIPVLCEIDETMTLDPKDVERKMTKDVKAVIPVNMVGFACDMNSFLGMKEKYGIRILEDACQADGGSYKGKRFGSIGDAGAFSFNDFKIMSAGEGGALLTNDRSIYERALIYHDGGAAFRPYTSELNEKIFMGTQYRVSEVTGAILRIQLQRLDGILSDLRRIKKNILTSLDKAGNLRITPSNDPQGDCATTVSLTFDTSAEARTFASYPGIKAWLPIDSGKHVYSNWTPLLSGDLSHHRALNPLGLKENSNLRKEYSADMCPKTTDILSRTVYISLHCDWNEDKVNEVIANIRKAASII